MKKQVNPKVVFTLAFVIGLLILVIVRNNNRLTSWKGDWMPFAPASASLSPEDVVYAMLDAQRNGNTRAYLDVFSGPLRDQLQQVVKEDSPATFASYLVRNADFRGVAVTVTDRPTAEDALVRVEYVYPDRNEVQKLHLRREGKQWRIVQVAGAEQIKSLLPYDSPVAD